MCTLESSRIAICTEKLQKQRILGLAGSQMKGNLDRLGSGQICKLVSLSGLLLFETDFWQKNSTLFLVLGPAIHLEFILVMECQICKLTNSTTP